MERMKEGGFFYNGTHFDVQFLKLFLILLFLSIKNVPNRLANDFSSVQDGRVETWAQPDTFQSTRNNFLPSPLFSFTES